MRFFYTSVNKHSLIQCSQGSVVWSIEQRINKTKVVGSNPIDICVNNYEKLYIVIL